MSFPPGPASSSLNLFPARWSCAAASREELAETLQTDAMRRAHHRHKSPAANKSKLPSGDGSKSKGAGADADADADVDDDDAVRLLRRSLFGV